MLLDHDYDFVNTVHSKLLSLALCVASYASAFPQFYFLAVCHQASCFGHTDADMRNRSIAMACDIKVYIKFCLT